MASPGLLSALQQGLPIETYYNNIRNFAASANSPEELIAAAQQYGISGEDIMRATGESPLSTYSPDSGPSNFALAQALESIPTTINTGVQYNPQTRDVDQGVAAQSDFNVVNPRTGQLENVEPASNYIPGAPANQFVVSSGQGVFEQGDKRFQPVNLVTVDAQGNVTPSGTFNIEKNELSDFAKIVGTGTKLAATALSAYAIGSSLLEAAGLSNSAAGTMELGGGFTDGGALSSVVPGGTIPGAAATTFGDIVVTGTPAVGGVPPIVPVLTGAVAANAALNNPPNAPPSDTPPPAPPPTDLGTVTVTAPPVTPPPGVPPIVPIVPITPGGTPTTPPPTNPPTPEKPPANDPNIPPWLLSLTGLAGGADKLLSSASPLLSMLSSNEAAKNTIEALRNQGTLAKTEYRSLADEATKDINFTPYGVTTGLFGTTVDPTTKQITSTYQPGVGEVVGAAGRAALGSFEQAGTADLNQMTADRMALYQQLVGGEQQRSRLAQEARLQAQGRLGVGAGGGEYAPELKALEDAIAKQNLQFALAAPQEALAQRGALITQGQAASQVPIQLQQQQLAQLQLGGQLGQQAAQTAYQRGGLLSQVAGTGISENLMAQLAAAQVQAERDKALATAFSGMGNRSGSGGGMFTDILNFGKDLYNFGRSI
jgi:hypothetical protein